LLFDFLLILILIYFFFKSSAKASLESFIWVLGAFVSIRVSGMFYLTLAEILRGIFSALDKGNSQYISYLLLIFLVSFIYIFFLRPKIALLAKFIPKKILFLISSTFTVLSGFMIFVMLYATLNSFPLIDKLPPRVRNAKSEILVVWTIGSGSLEFIKTMRHGLNELDNPIEYLKDKQKLLNSSGKKIKDAANAISRD